MTDFVIGLVTEGPTDQQVLNELINAYFNQISDAGKKISFLTLQPIDRTTGGGWRNVYKWCISNNQDARETLLGKNRLFANEMDNHVCDALLIHMDADICEVIGKNTNVVPVPNASSVALDRGKFIKNVIEQWLWPDQPLQNDMHIIAPAVESIEAWLVAGLSSEDPSPESNRDVQKRLAELNYIVVKKTTVPVDIKKTAKSEENYRKILTVAKTNLQRIYDSCPHFRSMVQEIHVAMNLVH